MNILFIAQNLLPTNGGVERVTYLLSEAFKKRGYNIFFIFNGFDYDIIQEQYKLKFNSSETTNNLIKSFSKFIETNNIDIVICQNIHQTKYQNVYKELKNRYNIKIITCLHANPDIWVNKNKWGCTTPKIYFKELIRSIKHCFKNEYKEQIIGMYELSDKYVLLSEYFISIFKNLYSVSDSSKLVAISNPCTFNADMSDIQSKENIVLVVGRIVEQQKRISNVLFLWKELFRNRSDWKLIIVGDGPDLDIYKKMAHRMKLKNVQFEGHSNNVEQYYRKSKIFLMTSIWEGFGLTIVEAQNYGCVPIVFDTYAAVHDIIRDGENGYIIPIHNRFLYTQQLDKLMRDTTLWKQMSSNARVSVKNKFDINQISDKWEILIRQLQNS